MSISEKLTSIIKSKGLTKKEFAQKLIDLSPKVNRVGETPTLPTIYGYLNGRISIPVDLISYMAEALGICEQELFDTSLDSKRKFFSYIVEHSSETELKHYKNILSNKLLLDMKNIEDCDAKTFEDKNRYKIEEIMRNIKYAPTPFLDKLVELLKKYKDITRELSE